MASANAVVGPASFLGRSRTRRGRPGPEPDAEAPDVGEPEDVFPEDFPPDEKDSEEEVPAGADGVGVTPTGLTPTVDSCDGFRGSDGGCGGNFLGGCSEGGACGAAELFCESADSRSSRLSFTL